jgi:hypothetical protein
MHYRERMSECRNCEMSDAVFKICYQSKNRLGAVKKGKAVFND